MNVLWHLLQTSDSTFPVGGFAHSLGLEGMVQAGLVDSVSELESFIQDTWLPVMTHTDFPLIRLSRQHAWQDEAIHRMDRLAWACRATSESRRAQQHMGAQRLKLVAGMTRHPRLLQLAESAQTGQWLTQWPVVWGIESAILKQPVEESLLAYGYQGINGLLSASVKLIRVGPTDIQQILYRSQTGVEHAIHNSIDVHEADIGWFTPMLDITGACHENAYTRLFIS